MGSGETMKYAIDIDGTLSKRPDVFFDLINSLGPDKCVFLTGSTDINVPMEQHQSGRRRQVEGLIGSRLFVEIHICVEETHENVSIAKGNYCRDNGIDVLFDDCERYCNDVSRISPKTLVLQVKP